MLGVAQIEDGIAGSYMMVWPKDTTPLIGVVALEQMGYKVDPTTGKLIKITANALNAKCYVVATDYKKKIIGMSPILERCSKSSLLSVFIILKPDWL